MTEHRSTSTVTELVMDVMREAAAAVRLALDGLDDWSSLGSQGAHVGQYRCDVAADLACSSVLLDAGFGVMSEESGLEAGERDVVVVVDPVDGSTNASRGLPWFATSLCAIDDEGPLAALVVNQATGMTYEAVRGGGARRDGAPIRPSACSSVGDAVVGLSGRPARHLGWRQYRALGASALDLCAVADGTLDAFVDCTLVGLERGGGAHGPWDWLGGWLVCVEAGATVVDALGRDLLVYGHADRRTPIAAATGTLAEHLRESLLGP